MANYLLLKESERDILDNLKVYFSKTIDSYKYLYESSTNETNDDDIYEKIKSMNKKSFRRSEDILFESTWLIQKHQPKTKHLRIFIAIIYSIKDLERINTYIYKYTRFSIKKSKSFEDVKFKDFFLQFLDLIIQTMDSIFKVFEKFDFPEMLEESEEIFKKFLIKYDAIFFNFIDYIHTNKEIDTVEISKAVIIAKNFDRTIDHCMNIIESFSYIE